MRNPPDGSVRAVRREQGRWRWVFGSGDLAAAASGEADGAEGEEAEGRGFRDGGGFDADAGDIFVGPFVDGDGAWVGGGLRFDGEAHPCEVFSGADVEADAEVAGVGACEGPLAVGVAWAEGHASAVADDIDCGCGKHEEA